MSIVYAPPNGRGTVMEANGCDERAAAAVAATISPVALAQRPNLRDDIVYACVHVTQAHLAPWWDVNKVTLTRQVVKRSGSTKQEAMWAAFASMMALAVLGEKVSMEACVDTAVPAAQWLTERYGDPRVFDEATGLWLTSAERDRLAAHEQTRRDKDTARAAERAAASAAYYAPEAVADRAAVKAARRQITAGMVVQVRTPIRRGLVLRSTVVDPGTFATVTHVGGGSVELSAPSRGSMTTFVVDRDVVAGWLADARADVERRT